MPNGRMPQRAGEGVRTQPVSPDASSVSADSHTGMGLIKKIAELPSLLR